MMEQAEHKHDLPSIQVFNYYEPEDPDGSGGRRVEFRLIYQGSLPSEKCEDKLVVGSGGYGRAKDKHRLRKHFHLQLRELWKEHPDLRAQAEQRFVVLTTPSNQVSDPGPNVQRILRATGPIEGAPNARSIDMIYPTSTAGAKTWLEHIADSHIRCNGNRFVPLISEAGGFTCDLKILFLRRDNPGGLINNLGDIDNRIKVLFDGLRMPVEVKELGGYAIDQDENPFFCLLENDRLITSVTVTTDRLVIPLKAEENISDVLLVIHVTMVTPSAVFGGDRPG